MGDYISSNKAGDIIPEVEKIIIERRIPELVPYSSPYNHPFCNKSLSQVNGQPYYLFTKLDSKRGS